MYSRAKAYVNNGTERGRGLPAQGGESFREHVRALQMLALRLTQGRMYLGSVARQLGKLAALRGRWNDAVRHLRKAIARDRRMGAPPFVALGRYEYARALLARGGRGAGSQARPLLERALATAINLDMEQLRADATGLLAKC